MTFRPATDVEIYAYHRVVTCWNVHRSRSVNISTPNPVGLRICTVLTGTKYYIPILLAGVILEIQQAGHSLNKGLIGSVFVMRYLNDSQADLEEYRQVREG